VPPGFLAQRNGYAISQSVLTCYEVSFAESTGSARGGAGDSVTHDVIHNQFVVQWCRITRVCAFTNRVVVRKY